MDFQKSSATFSRRSEAVIWVAYRAEGDVNGLAQSGKSCSVVADFAMLIAEVVLTAWSKRVHLRFAK